MNRRSFFRSLSSAVAGVYVACHVNLARVTESVAAAVAKKEWVINPEWVNAPYELAVYRNVADSDCGINAEGVVMFRRTDKQPQPDSVCCFTEGQHPMGLIREAYPNRLDENTKLVQPFILL